MEGLGLKKLGVRVVVGNSWDWEDLGAFGVGVGAGGGPKSCERVPDGDGVSRPSSDVPAAVEPGRVLEGPTRTGDYTTRGPEELRAVAARCWMETRGHVGQPDTD